MNWGFGSALRRGLILAISVGAAIVIPRLIDPWYTQCPTFNCFPTSEMTLLVSLGIGLVSASLLNSAITYWVRRRN